MLVFDVWGKHKYVLTGSFSISVEIFETFPGRTDAPLSRAKLSNSILINRADYIEPRPGGQYEGGGSCTDSSGVMTNGNAYEIEIIPKPIQVTPKTLFGTAGTALSDGLGVISTDVAANDISFNGGIVATWGEVADYAGDTISGSTLPFTHTFQRPGSYVIQSHIKFQYTIPDSTNSGCEISREPVVYLFTPVEIEALDVSIAIPESLSTRVNTVDNELDAYDVLSGVGGIRDWSIATIEGYHIGVGSNLLDGSIGNHNVPKQCLARRNLGSGR